VLLHIINYAVRGLIIVVGLVLLSGIAIPDSNENKFLTQVMGVVFIIWGIYRVVLYNSNYKRYKRYKNLEDDEN